MIVSNIKYINEPKPGGKYGSIKTANGITVMVPPDLLPLFALGMSCQVNTKQQTWGQGTPDERVVTIATSGPLQGHTGPVQGQGVQSGYQGASQAQPAYRANTGFQPRVVRGGGGRAEDLYNKANLDQARHIFITGVVGRAMGSGKFTASEIPVLTQAAIEAYGRLLDPVQDKPAAKPATYASYEPLDEPLPPALGDPGPELQ